MRTIYLDTNQSPQSNEKETSEALAKAGEFIGSLTVYREDW